MKSLRTKITILTACAIIVAMLVAILFARVTIGELLGKTANNTLYLLCENGEKNIDIHFKSILQSVETVSNYAEDDLETIELSQLDEHVARVDEVFAQTAKNTSGILTYYYRLDPEASPNETGFWYVDLDGKGFKPHEVTDITQYDKDDKEHLLWFNRPKESGEAVWLPPYFTDNLDEYVLSYNIPIYKGTQFVGVIGIEIDYDSIVELVNNITLYQNGYAFVSDADGNIIYHPRMSMDDIMKGQKTELPNQLSAAEETYTEYTYQGTQKQAVTLPLNNGMYLTVAVPTAEINSDWNKLFREMLLTLLILLVAFTVLTVLFARSITRPLRKLTQAAKEVDAGNYDVKLETHGKDEVGVLTGTFNQLIGHLKKHINELNDLAYSDALTSVHNKGAFDIRMRELQEKLEESDGKIEFAIGMFDCNNLKVINDEYGHGEGNTYLKAASKLICNTYKHSPVFRIGGDEFAVLLQNEDFENRKELERVFEARREAVNTYAQQPYEKVDIAYGIAVYDPQIDESVDGVIRRADELMYEHKRAQKEKKQ